MDEETQQPRVAFESEEFQQPATSSRVQASGIVGWVIQSSGGLIKNEKQAQYVLIGFIAAAAAFVLILILSGGARSAKLEAPPGQKIIYPENGPPRLEQRF